MSYSLILVRVPDGSSDVEIERAVKTANDAALSGARNEEAERLKRKLADALRAECPELTGGELDYPTVARSENIGEDDARQQYRYLVLAGPENGAGIEITIDDFFVNIEMAAGGTDEDWDDVWRYVDILVREGDFVVWDPQSENVAERPVKKPSRAKKGRGKSAKRGDDPNVEPEDERRGGEVARVITSIIDNAIAAPLATTGFRRSGRTWRRVLDDGAIQVVNVQWSPRRDREAWFTLNAGVYFPSLAQSLALFPVTKSPKEWDCHVRKRPLLPGVNGWEVRAPGVAEADSDLGDGVVSRFFSWLDRRADSKAPAQHERATRELRESLERYGFPWLERVSNLRGAVDDLTRGGHLFWAAHASLLLNDREAAASLLERELAKSKSNPEYAETVRAWGRANRLME